MEQEHTGPGADPESARATCPECGRAKARRENAICRVCYLNGRFPTPLRVWRRQSGRDFKWLARETGVSYATIMRIAAGEKAAGDSALKLSRVTRISVEMLLRGSTGSSERTRARR